MKNYIDLVKNILDNGENVESRAGNCKVLTHQSLSFDLRDGFPRLTNRYVPFKSVAVELEGFIGGITSKKWYQDRGCKFWDEWANPEAVARSLQNQDVVHDYDYKDAAKNCDDLGPIYGWQWRRQNQAYLHGANSVKMIPEAPDNSSRFQIGDQLNKVLLFLEKNPSDRRMRVSSVNLSEENYMALPACHDYWKVDVVNGNLDLFFHMRSTDLILGMPANLQSYAMLATLLARHGNFTARKLTVFSSNCHIYETHLSGAEKLIGQVSHEPPKIAFNDYGDFWDWTHEDISCEGYEHSGKIRFPVSV